MGMIRMILIIASMLRTSDGRPEEAGRPSAPTTGAGAHRPNRAMGTLGRRRATVVVACSLLITACGTRDSGPDHGGTVIVATNSIIGDIAQAVAGDDAEVVVLTPRGADPHDFQVSAQQAAIIQTADLVLANGLGLEETIADVLDSAAADGANIHELAPNLQPLAFAGGADLDPHFWFDPERVAGAARLIASHLENIDTTIDWAARADAYAGTMAVVDAEIQALVSEIPADRRKLVTNHDSLGYFADRYGFEVVGTVIPGGATLAEPSSADLAELVRLIREEEVAAIFAETTEPAALAKSIAAELAIGLEVVTLFTGSLGGPGSGAESLAEMLTLNARRIAEALR